MGGRVGQSQRCKCKKYQLRQLYIYQHCAESTDIFHTLLPIYTQCRLPTQHPAYRRSTAQLSRPSTPYRSLQLTTSTPASSKHRLMTWMLCPTDAIYTCPSAPVSATHCRYLSNIYVIWTTHCGRSRLTRSDAMAATSSVSKSSESSTSAIRQKMRVRGAMNSSR